MKYLKIIIFACIALQTTFTFSQSNFLDCEFVPDASMYNASKYSATVKSDFSTDEPLIFNVIYHVLNHTDGTNPDGITEEHLLESIALLNIKFNQYNIFYKYRGYEEYNDTSFYNAPINQIVNAIRNGNFNTSINVIITRSLPAAGALVEDQLIVMPAFALNTDNLKVSMVHEFGHLAGLLHIFEGTDYAPNCITSPTSEFCIDNDTEYQIGAFIDGVEIFYAPPFLNTPNFYEVGQTGYGFIENVTRDVNDINFNADEKGDMVVDTPATFSSAFHNFILDFDNIYHYIEHLDIVDEVGEQYVDIDFQNFMSYAQIPRTHFTDGQGVRMRETILEPSNTYFAPRMTEVASLYEPYAGNYDINGGINSTKFQPGFDYEFVECSNWHPVPTDYGDHNFQFGNIYGGDYSYDFDKFYLGKIKHLMPTAIRIIQLDNQPEKCYNQFKNIIGGKVTKFNDNVLNTNVTITPKNAEDMNDNNLIQNLQQGLYKIEENYDDGSKKETIIYKSNN